MAAELPRIVLASGSPRRSELLQQLGVEFTVAPPDIDETERRGEAPIAYVRRVATEKAEASPLAPGEVLIAADTTVDVDGAILAKPVDLDDARRMLKLLSGRAHRVHTGVAVRYEGRMVADVATAIVKMAPITDDTMAWYLGTGEPMGKAGAYAIQGEAAALVEGVQGHITTVIGLPLGLLGDLFARLDLSLAAMIRPLGDGD